MRNPTQMVTDPGYLSPMKEVKLTPPVVAPGDEVV